VVDKTWGANGIWNDVFGGRSDVSDIGQSWW